MEVVLNHIEPYDLKKQPSTFDLQTVLTIDTESEDLAKAGMGSAGEFDVDGQGNISIVAFKNLKYFIFNSDGIFIGRKNLDISWLGLHYGSKYATVNKGLFYCYKEKESGYRELTVQKIIWK